MKYYQSKKFKAEQAKWYRVLAKDGFVEQEDVSSPKEFMKAWHDNKFKKLTPDEFAAKQAYYTKARHFLLEHKFVNKLDKEVWAMHAEGESYRDIAIKINKAGTATLAIINRIKGFMNGIEVRTMRDTDKNFIYATWLRGVYHGSWASQISRSTFFKFYPSVIDKIINDPDCIVLVAHLSSDPSVILGYCVFRPNKLDYIFVKELWRKQGIAKMMLKGLSFKEHTHTTELGKKLAKKMKLNYNPFAI